MQLLKIRSWYKKFKIKAKVLFNMPNKNCNSAIIPIF
jgi:hypothetical protein